MDEHYKQRIDAFYNNNLDFFNSIHFKQGSSICNRALLDYLLKNKRKWKNDRKRLQYHYELGFVIRNEFDPESINDNELIKGNDDYHTIDPADINKYVCCMTSLKLIKEKNDILSYESKITTLNDFQQAGNSPFFFVFNELFIPCLISVWRTKNMIGRYFRNKRGFSVYDLDEPYSVYSFSPNNWIEFIDQRIESVKNKSKEDIKNDFEEQAIILTKNENQQIHDYNIKKMEPLNENNTFILFLNSLIQYPKSKSKSDNCITIESNTLELENSKFGLRAEKALFRFLTKLFREKQWIKNLDRIDKDLINYVRETKSNIEWLNEYKESFKPIDFILQFNDKKANKIFIEAKATRNKNETTLYFSINELKEAIKYKRQYFIARLVYFDKELKEEEVLINDEFYLKLYMFSEESNKTISEKIEEWEEYYEETTIPISIDNLIEVKNISWISDLPELEKEVDVEKYIFNHVGDILKETIDCYFEYPLNLLNLLYDITNENEEVIQYLDIRKNEIKKISFDIIKDFPET